MIRCYLKFGQIGGGGGGGGGHYVGITFHNVYSTIVRQYAQSQHDRWARTPLILWRTGREERKDKSQCYFKVRNALKQWAVRYQTSSELFPDCSDAQTSRSTVETESSSILSTYIPIHWFGYLNILFWTTSITLLATINIKLLNTCTICSIYISLLFSFLYTFTFSSCHPYFFLSLLLPPCLTILALFMLPQRKDTNDQGPKGLLTTKCTKTIPS